MRCAGRGPVACAGSGSRSRACGSTVRTSSCAGTAITGARQRRPDSCSTYARTGRGPGVSRVSRDYFKLDLGVLRPDRWLFAAGSARRLAAVRIALCALLALRVGLRPSLYLDLSQQEASLFRPLSWAKLFDHMPSRGVLLVALIVCVVAALCAAAGFRGRIALPIAWVAGVFLNGFLTSQGKVVHNDVLLLLCMFVLIPARHSDTWSVDAWLARRRGAAPPPDRSVSYGWPIRTAIVL